MALASQNSWLHIKTLSFNCLELGIALLLGTRFPCVNNSDFVLIEREQLGFLY